MRGNDKFFLKKSPRAAGEERAVGDAAQDPRAQLDVPTGRVLDTLIVIRPGVVSSQICVAKGLSDKEVVALANKLNPSGLRLFSWNIHAKGPDPVRVQCAKHPDREHIVLVC